MASHQGMVTLALTVVLLALPSLTYGVTLHVRPTSSNTSCPTHPCHTLSEHAQYPGQNFNDSNLTLQFLPGNHSLNVNVTITSIHRLEILGNSSAVVPAMVVCSFRVGFAFRDITEVRMNGLAFVACAKSHVTQIGQHRFTTYYGLHLQSVQTAEIIDCTFQDSYGSALGVVDTHVLLKGCSFLSNCRHCSNGRCSFWGPTCYGGGVFADKSNLTFTGNNKFIHNSAKRYGGGVYAVSFSNVKISGNTTFINNSASLHGGGLYALTYGNTTIIGNTTFIGNSANEYGGGVYTWSNLNISVLRPAPRPGRPALLDHASVAPVAAHDGINTAYDRPAPAAQPADARGVLGGADVRAVRPPSAVAAARARPAVLGTFLTR